MIARWRQVFYTTGKGTEMIRIKKVRDLWQFLQILNRSRSTKNIAFNKYQNITLNIFLFI